MRADSRPLTNPYLSRTIYLIHPVQEAQMNSIGRLLAIGRSVTVFIPGRWPFTKRGRTR